MPILSLRLNLEVACFLFSASALELIALPLVIDMLVAYITADREALLSFISDPDKFVAAAPFTFLVASLVVPIFGAGWFSLDALVAGRRDVRRIRENGRRSFGIGCSCLKRISVRPLADENSANRIRRVCLGWRRGRK